MISLPLYCVCWYCKYGISYRELEEMLEERGIAVYHTTLYRWVQTYAPEIEKRLRWHRQGGGHDGSWRVNETYVKVKGKLKRLIKPTLGFKSMTTAYATLKGFEVMRMFRKGQFDCWYPAQGAQGVAGEIRLINRQFGIYSI